MTITSHPDLLVELEKIRLQEYSLDDEELSIGLRAVAAPIHDSAGGILAAVNVTGTTQELSYKLLENTVIPALLNLTKQISTAYGYVKFQPKGER